MRQRTRNFLCGLAIAATFGTAGYLVGSSGKEDLSGKIKDIPAMVEQFAYGENCDKGFEIASSYLSDCTPSADDVVILSKKMLSGVPQDYLTESIELQQNLDLTTLDQLLPYANAIKDAQKSDFNTEYAGKVTPERFMSANDVKCLDNVAGDSRFMSMEYKGKEIIPLSYELLGEEQITFVEKSRLSSGVQEQLNEKLSLLLEKEVNVQPDNYVMVGPPTPN